MAMKAGILYYRLLYSSAHFRDWQDGHFHSYHYSVPGEWMELYYKGIQREPGGVPLDLDSGRHTQAAKNAFLELAKEYKRGEIWTEEHRKRVSQLDGVCAFTDLDSVDQYARGTLYGGMMVAEFEGTYVGKIPESQFGLSGVLVKPTRIVALRRFHPPCN